jgi:hypothetical protein
MKRRLALPPKSMSETKRVEYLLGMSGAAERDHTEVNYFDDDDAFQEMLSAEDDLIDAYARGELTLEERRRFEDRFESPLGGRDRVQFARALADVVAVRPPVKTKLRLNIFQPRGLLRIATIAAGIALAVGLGWLLSDRTRMMDELRDLRAESVELSKRTEALQQSSDSEPTRSAAIAARLAAARLGAQQVEPDKPRHSGGVTKAIQQPRHLPEVERELEKVATSKPDQPNTTPPIQADTLGDTFVARRITQLPLEARNVPNLLSLQTAPTRDGYVVGNRTDQSNITLDGVDTTIRIPSFLSGIKFRLTFETAAIHHEYRLIVQTAEGRSVTAIDWIEPLTPDQVIIDTPLIPIGTLAPGDYVLLLMGREPDGSLVEVAQYSFKVIR